MDLPIYSEPMLRTRLQFADLERLRGINTSAVWEKSDGYIEQLEGGAAAGKARHAVQEATKAGLLQIHAIVFDGREGAGTLRRKSMRPLYRGQDCPEPEFIDRSLDNFSGWLTAESISSIHPIERAALALTRVADIWPFDFGNLTAAIMFANVGLWQAGFGPFFVLSEHVKEFKTVVGQAMTIETQPLVNAIYNTIKREMEAIAAG